MMPTHTWDRAFYAPRCDKPWQAVVIQSHGSASFIFPVAAPDGVMDRLTKLVEDRIKRPYLRPGERR